MEDLFLRLNRPVPELVKAVTLRRNLKSELIQGLGVTEYFDIYSLKKDCRTLESNFRRINSRQSQFNSRNNIPYPRNVRFGPTKINSVDVATLGLDDCYKEMPEETFLSNFESLQLPEGERCLESGNQSNYDRSAHHEFNPSSTKETNQFRPLRHGEREFNAPSPCDSRHSVQPSNSNRNSRYFAPQRFNPQRNNSRNES